MLGMRRALEGVAHAADVARIDGNALPRGLPCPAEAWIGGDARDRAIMAASILAKVTRDRHDARSCTTRWPHYGFDEHKGYGTPAHLAALRTHGPCPQHRRSFAPVREAMGTAAPVREAMGTAAPVREAADSHVPTPLSCRAPVPEAL